MMKFILAIVSVPLIALSLVITLAILKSGWDIINGKKPPDSKSDSKLVELDHFCESDSDGKDA